MVLSIEHWALKVGLKINGPKTEFMLWDPSAPAVTLHLASGLSHKLVKDFKYLAVQSCVAIHY